MSYHSATLSLLLQFLFHVAGVVGGVVLHTSQLLIVKSTKVLREDIVKQSVEDQKAKDLHDDFRHVVLGLVTLKLRPNVLGKKISWNDCVVTVIHKVWQSFLVNETYSWCTTTYM